MIRSFACDDYNFYKNSSIEFYSSDAVCHSIPPENFDKTFDMCLSDSPFVKGYILEYEGKRAGYALLSLSFSCEAGGIVVWVEEVYVLPEFQGRGLGKEFFEYVHNTYADASRFRLEVGEKNKRVMEYYKRLGYEKLSYIQMCKEEGN